MHEMKVPSHKIEFTEAQMQEILADVDEILTSGKVILGQHTELFEQEFARRCERKFGVAVSSDTAAFEMMLKILDVKGKPVLFPALGFASILQAVRNVGAEPWFLDARLDQGLFATAGDVEVAAAICEEATGQKPAALILMHTGGLLAGQSTEIVATCDRLGIPVFEDAAHAMGATLNGRPAGSWGKASAFSLYATKPMHACEGGMIVTDDEEIAEEAKIRRNYGRISDFGRSVVVREGYSWRITEIQSAIGRSNLSVLPKNLEMRRSLLDMYDGTTDHWADRFGVTQLPYPPGLKPNGYRYLMLLPDTDMVGAGTAMKAALKNRLRNEFAIDLPGDVYELPAHWQPVWAEEYDGVSCPVAESFCERHFSLPVYPSLLDNDAEAAKYVVTSVEKVLTDLL